MITRRTVFIVGAGASVPYGFPIGIELVDQAIRLAAEPNDTRVQPILEACGCSFGRFKAFGECLERSGTSSIDRFLEGRDDFLDVGKAVIATLLIPFETEANLFRSGHPHFVSMRWYPYVLDRMGSKAEEFRQNNLSILTFNYDRSFEQFLLIALQNRYGIGPLQAAQLLADLPIEHLHGSLGSLPDLDLNAASQRPYSPVVDAASVKSAADAISVVHEDIASYPQFGRAKQLLRDAEEIWFLGFGYLRTNIERLGLLHFVPDTSGSVRLFGTAFKSLEGERASAQRLLCESSNVIILGHQNADVLTLLRYHWLT